MLVSFKIHCCIDVCSNLTLHLLDFIFTSPVLVDLFVSEMTCIVYSGMLKPVITLFFNYWLIFVTLWVAELIGLPAFILLPLFIVRKRRILYFRSFHNFIGAQFVNCSVQYLVKCLHTCVMLLPPMYHLSVAVLSVGSCWSTEFIWVTYDRTCEISSTS